MDKVEKICETLTKETLEPAKKKAREIIKNAEREAEELLENARRQSEGAFEEAKKKMIQERRAQETSLKLAVRKSIDKLKYSIEEEIFSKAIDSSVNAALQGPGLVVKIIESMVRAVDKEGIDGDLQLILSQSGLQSDLAKHIQTTIWDRLQKSGVVLGQIKGGAQLKIIEKNLTLDMSQEAIVGLLSSFVRDEVRSLILNHE
ncbi:hypothetical protein COB21_01160 [Candidatus Aerophobetes bacterium]|uniref:V-ATPase subunit E n=1 Tax=Aerophobetes bacterium TaxID=2030807 RepID=A0A2A4X891_UNCAE|nr:MAG: hypothetical protein COB21_01160 [Candidatus Aerophobetes bacterium]